MAGIKSCCIFETEKRGIQEFNLQSSLLPSNWKIRHLWLMLLPETEFPCMKIAKYVFNRLLITFVVLDALKVLGSRIVIFGIKAFRSLVNPLGLHPMYTSSSECPPRPRRISFLNLFIARDLGCSSILTQKYNQLWELRNSLQMREGHTFFSKVSYIITKKF